MNEHVMPGLTGQEPLGFLAAIGVLTVASQSHGEAKLAWRLEGHWSPVLQLPSGVELVELLRADLGRWEHHPVLAPARTEDRKLADLKHPPSEFRRWMRDARASADEELQAYVAAFGTGVTVDGSGQSKPTSFHFCAAQQIFLWQVRRLRDEVSRDDLEEALRGPWVGRSDTSTLRWRAGADRNRALLSFDPSSVKGTNVPGAEWLAFRGLGVFCTVPKEVRSLRTVGFEGRGKQERFVWPLWTAPLAIDEVRSLVGARDLASADSASRAARGVAQVFAAEVVRSGQGYGNFAAASPA